MKFKILDWIVEKSITLEKDYINIRNLMLIVFLFELIMINIMIAIGELSI
jgi:hypothetical protein